MTFSIREYKLAGPEGDGRNPYINARGVFVGDGTPLIEKDPEGRWRPKVRQELEGALSKTCRNFVDMESHIRSLDHVARALNNNDFALANIA